ncbi:MAG: hypothetical protein WA733_25430 [Methylocystis sp.]
MLYYLILIAAVLLGLFGAYAYGSLNDGLRLTFIIMTVIFFGCVLLLSSMLVFRSETAPTVAGGTPSIPETPLIKAAPVPPKPSPAATPAVLPPLAAKGTSFHLEPGRSSPIFRIPNGKKAHVSVYHGGLTVYSGGVVKATCDPRGFTIAGTGDGNQFVACDTAVDVVIDDMSD